jgi:imidazolonepropionase-like amidohydrolase
MADELGLIKEGYLADLVMLDGNPVKNIKIVQDKDKILMVMKDGKYHKAPMASRNEAQRVAAE